MLVGLMMLALIAVGPSGPLLERGSITAYIPIVEVQSAPVRLNWVLATQNTPCAEVRERCPRARRSIFEWRSVAVAIEMDCAAEPPWGCVFLVYPRDRFGHCCGCRFVVFGFDCYRSY
ncbi:hypothetical protein Tcan_00842, partial [Toxocara canis]